MSQDIDSALFGWDFQPGMILSRMVKAANGRQVIQVRADLGVIQMELNHRPDGNKVHGFNTYLEYLQSLADEAAQKKGGEPFVMEDRHCIDADCEFFQFYQRRVAYLALNQFERAIRDSDHTLNFMDFVKEHSPSQEYTMAHEQYRPFVLFHRTLAATESFVTKEQPDKAIEALNEGLEHIKEVYTEHGLEEKFEDDQLVAALNKRQEELRKKHKVKATLKEQLDQAVEKEDYETAARLRDEIRKRGM